MEYIVDTCDQGRKMVRGKSVNSYLVKIARVKCVTLKFSEHPDSEVIPRFSIAGGDPVIFTILPKVELLTVTGRLVVNMQ
jgi:hypothetical protein